MMLQIIFSDNDWLICLNWHPLNILNPRPFLYPVSLESGHEQDHASIPLHGLQSYCLVITDLTPRAHVQADVNSRVEWVALNYFDVTVKVRFAHMLCSLLMLTYL